MIVITAKEFADMFRTKKVAISASYFPVPEVAEKLKEADVVFTTNPVAAYNLLKGNPEKEVYVIDSGHPCRKHMDEAFLTFGDAHDLADKFAKENGFGCEMNMPKGFFDIKKPPADWEAPYCTIEEI